MNDNTAPEEVNNEAGTSDVSVEENYYISDEIIPYIETIIGNQSTEIEQLMIQNAYMQEQINGFTMVINYQFATIGIIVIGAVVALA